MLRKTKKAISIVLIVVMLLGVIIAVPTTASALTQNEFNSKIATLKQQYPNGSVCTSTKYGYSCFGWAYLMGELVFGSAPTSWATNYSLSNVKAGDLIQYGNTTGSGHTVFVVSVSGNNITFADCNGNGNRNSAGAYVAGLCMVKWDNTTTISANALFGYKFAYIKQAPSLTSGYNPEGVFDGVKCVAPGQIRVHGWAFDRDNLSAQLSIHIYVDGKHYSTITANKSRPDVNKAYPGVGDNHGFDDTIILNQGGTHNVKAYAINVGGGSNVLLNSGDKSVTVTADNEKPIITKTQISKVSHQGYRVTCYFSDNVGVTSVKFPSWTAANGQDDIIWHEGTISGKTASVYINKSQHNNEMGVYYTHIYAYDAVGNQFSVNAGSVELQTEPQEIASTTYNGNKYTVFTADKSWTATKKWCEENGGHLVTITSSEEWNVVEKLLEKFNGVPCWLGAESTSGTWKWVTGEEFSYKCWDTGQPDCSGKTEFYLGTFDSGKYMDCYKWNDYPDVYTMIGGFVCEYEKEEETTEPTTVAPTTEPTTESNTPTTDSTESTEVSTTKPSETNSTTPTETTTKEPLATTEPSESVIPTTESINSTTEPLESTSPTTTSTPPTTESSEPKTEPTQPTAETTQPITETAPISTEPSETTEPISTEPADPTTEPTELSPTTSEKTDISDWTVIGLADAAYTGKEVTQIVAVTDGTDYATFDVSYKNNVKAGNAAIIIKGTGDYTGTIVETFKITKAKQPMTVKAKTKSVSVSKLRWANQNVKNAITVKKNKGKITYAKVAKGSSKYLKISKKGVITFARGWYYKGTYKIKVKVTASGNSNYKKGSKTVTVKIKVK